MTPTTYGSVCSGIEAASVAFLPLGWECEWLAEIETAPTQILAYHYPKTPNLGDMTKIPQLLRNGDIRAPDNLWGGTPCQAFSVAGNRNSLDDARGNLSLTYCDIANEIDIQRSAAGLLPCIIGWENVPGVLSTKDNAFGCFLGQLAGEDEALVPEPCPPAGKSSRWWRWDKKTGEHAPSWPDAGAVLGPKRAIAWRVLDAQYFGLAQRRKRVIVVASAREGFDPLAVLFESEGVRRDCPPSRSAGQDTAGTLAARTDGGGFPGTDEACSGYVQPVAKTICAGGNSNNPLDENLVPLLTFSAHAQPDEMRFDPHVTSALTCSQQQAVCVTGDITHTLKAEGFDASEDGTGRGQPIVAAFAQNTRDELRYVNGDGSIIGALSAHPGMKQTSYAQIGMAVRRLMPIECERLQGFTPVRKEITLDICLDHQKTYADVALSCRKSQSSAWPAAASKSMQPVPVAGRDSSTSPANRAPLAVLRVRQDSVAELLEIRSHGRLIWSASSAATSSKPPLPMQIANIAATLARISLDLDQQTISGKAALRVPIRLSFQAPNGEQSALLSGAGSEAFASDATPDAQPAKFTTSKLGHATPTCGSSTATWLCSALDVISSCIPNETLPENFSLAIEIEQSYTAIPLPGRRKEDGEVRIMADGPRYKALGNSWAVTKFRWLGARIDARLRAMMEMAA